MSSKFFVQEDLSRAAKSRRRELEKLMRSIKAREPERRSTLLCFCFCFVDVCRNYQQRLLLVCSDVVFDVVVNVKLFLLSSMLFSDILKMCTRCLTS